MTKALFITGTGTDVGKTYVTGLILKKLKDNGINAGYYKAAMSGNERDEKGELIPGDGLKVKSLSGIIQPLHEMCPYVYENAVSPHLASRIEGNPVTMNVVKEYYKNICNKHSYVAVEGSGGILCPLNYDEEKIELQDVIKEFGLTSLIICQAGLGTINSVVLTVEYMKKKNLPVEGIIFNNFHPGDALEEDNIKMCEEMTGIKVIAKVKSGDKEIDIDTEVLKKFFKEI